VLVTEVDGGVVEPKKCTVAELRDAWLDHIEQLGRSPSTLYGHRRLVRQLPEGFLGQPIGKVTPKVLDDLYRLLSKQTTRKPATVLRFHSVLRAAFHQVVRWGWLERNPVERATRRESSRSRRCRRWSPTSSGSWTQLPHPGTRRTQWCSASSPPPGCRRGEVCGLKWSAVDIDGDMPRVMIRRGVLDIQRQRIVRDTKNHGIRWVGLGPETAELLRRHRHRSFELGEVAGSPVTADDFVFPRSPGSAEPLPPNRIGQAWRRLYRQLGVKARLHDLRHLQASLLLDAGEAITTVTARLGHRDTSTTLKIYSHLMPGADQRAAGIVGKAFARPPAQDSPDA
jgi:integrase